MKSIKRIFLFAAPYKKILILAILFMILNTIFEGASIFSIVPMVDKVFSGKTIDITTSIDFPYKTQLNHFAVYLSSMDRLTVFKWIAIFTITAILLKSVFYYYSRIFMEKLGQHIVKDIRCEMFKSIEGLSLDFFSHSKTGALISRSTADVQVILEVISGNFATTLIEIPKLITYLILVIIIDWRLFAAVISIVFVVIPIAVIGKKIKTLTKRSQRKLADLNSILFEVITGIKIVQIFSMEKSELKKFAAENVSYYKARIKAVKLDNILTPMTEITSFIICVFVMLKIVPRIIEGSMSLGAFMLQAAALAAMFRPIKVLGKANSLIQRVVAAAERVFEVIDTKPNILEPANPLFLNPINEKLVFDRVSFAYEEALILNNLSFTVKKGEIAAFVGPSGGGKTTILNLVPRFYDPCEGEVLIDGIDIRRVSLDSLRKQVGIVTQETILFNDTVKANIAYGKDEIIMDDVISAAKFANAHDFIMAMPQGYDTAIGEKGVMLSGGQRQRLAIARAILKNPDILILDEATSALDTESERMVQEALNRLMKNRTVLVVAHRLSTVMHADKIFVIDNGVIQHQGTHNELLKSNNLYQRLYHT